MADFDIDYRREPQGTIARLRGHAANREAERLRSRLADLLAEKPGPVVLDLTELRFIASAGLAELIDFRRRLQDDGADLRLAGANAQVESIFLKTHLAELFPMFPDAESALAGRR